MIRADINITADLLLNLLRFELKDSLTLSMLERLIKLRYPGNYRFIRFVDPDVVSGDSVFLITTEFDSDSDRIRFMMEWNGYD